MFESTNNEDLSVQFISGSTGIRYAWELKSSKAGKLEFNKLGVGTKEPTSSLTVKGYIQLDTTAGSAPATDCNNKTEYGRMKIDKKNALLYICTQSGWIAKQTS